MHSDSSFFRLAQRKGDQGENLILMNTDIWNNKTIAGVTGYSIEMLKESLYELSIFIKQNLSPDRLAGFDVEAIKDLKDFQQ